MKRYAIILIYSVKRFLMIIMEKSFQSTFSKIYSLVFEKYFFSIVNFKQADWSSG